MADLPQSIIDNAMDGSDPASNGGALSQVASAPAQSATATAPSLFANGSNPYQDKLFDLLSKPAIDPSTKWLAFAGAMGAPTKTGSFAESLGGGLSALAKGQNEEDQLKQKYREALIAQYGRMAQQQNAMNWALGSSTGGQPGLPSSQQPAQPGMPPSGQAQSGPDQGMDQPVPGHYGMTRRDVGSLVMADPTGKALAEAKEKRATSSTRAGDLLFNMDPNGAGWVVNGTSLSAATIMKGISAQIESNNTVVKVPQSDGTEKTMSRTEALKLQNQLASLPGMPVSAPPVKPLVPGVQPATLADANVAPQANRLPPGPDRDAIMAATANQPGGPATDTPGGPEVGVSQTPGAAAAVKAHGEYAGGIAKSIHDDAETALQSNYALGELQSLAQNFTPGKAAPLRQAMAEYAQSANLHLDPDALNKAASMEAFNKIAIGLATQASRQLSARPSQLEFQKMVESNPNIALLPEGLQKIMVYTKFKNDTALQKEQAFNDWSKNVPPDQHDRFVPYWHQQQAQKLSNPAIRGSMDQATGPAAASVSPGGTKPQFSPQQLVDEMRRRGLVSGSPGTD